MAHCTDIEDIHGYKKIPTPILSGKDADARVGEKLTLYKGDMFVDENMTLGHQYVCAYNAKGDDHRESIFLAVSDDAEHWHRYYDRAVIFSDEENIRINGDPQVVRMNGRYVMFYFIYDRLKNTAYNTFAVSEDLVHWTKWQGKPLIEPEFPFENVYAHKQWIVKENGVVYHYYCAVNDKNERTIALATSRRLKT